MVILSPEEIKNALFERIKKTQETFDIINVNKEDNLDVVQTIYFKFYFDFSTAIEATLTSIMKLKYPDEFANKKMKITSQGTSNYLNSDEVKLLIDTETDNTIADIKDFYCEYVKIVTDGNYNQIGLEKKIKEYENFSSFYNTSRETRNKIAHGLINANVRYDNTILFKFMLSFYVLHFYHLSLYSC